MSQTNCSFCAKTQKEVANMIVGPTEAIAICDECISICIDLVPPGKSKLVDEAIADRAALKGIADRQVKAVLSPTRTSRTVAQVPVRATPEGTVIDGHLFEVDLSGIKCSECDEPMVRLTAEQLVEAKRAAEAVFGHPPKCQVDTHPHVRCRNCSPAWFVACIRARPILPQGPTTH